MTRGINTSTISAFISHTTPSYIPQTRTQTQLQAFNAVSLVSPCTRTIASAATYASITNILYLYRRSHLRKMTKRKLWRIRTTREPGVSIPLFIFMLLSWQLFVYTFPLVELVSTVLFSRVSFFYTYPKASGVGVIFEPIEVQHLNQKQRARHQIRMDWHSFNVNVGNIGKDGYRHPPTITMNVPHLDIPMRGIKHWPWRRRYSIKDL